MTHQEAHDALSDIVWWMKGYIAGTDPCAMSQQYLAARHMLDGALSVQTFINSLRPIEEQKEFQ